MIGLGIKNPKVLSEKQINEEQHKLKISDSLGYILNETFFENKFYELKNSKNYKEIKANVNDHFQPQQAIYINKEKNTIEACVFNCLADMDGMNLTWNKNHELEFFPPKYTDYIDTLFSINDYLNTISNTEKARKYLFNNDKKYAVLIYWTKFGGRQNKRFLQQIRKNIREFSGDSCNFIYINMDSFFGHAGR